MPKNSLAQHNLSLGHSPRKLGLTRRFRSRSKFTSNHINLVPDGPENPAGLTDFGIQVLGVREREQLFEAINRPCLRQIDEFVFNMFDLRYDVAQLLEFGGWERLRNSCLLCCS